MAKKPKKLDHGKLGLHRVDKNRYTKGGQTFKRTSKGFKKLPKGRPAPKAPKPGDDPLQPLTGKTMRRETEAASKLKYGPSEQQLQSQRRISDQSAVNQGGWWDDYINKVNSAGQAVQGAYGAAQQGVYNQANTARTQDDAQQTRIAADMQESAKQRGTTAQPDQGGSAAAASRQALSSAFGGLIGAQGANAAQYMGARSAAGGLHKLRALQDERSRRAKIESQAGELASEKGQFKVEYRGKLREGERTYALNRKAYNLDVDQLRQKELEDQRQDKREGKRDAALIRDRGTKNALAMTKAQLQKMQSDRTFALDQQKHGAAQAKDNYLKAHGLGPYNPGAGGKKGGPTKAERRAARDAYDQTRSLLNSSPTAQSFRKPGQGQKLVDAMLSKVDGPEPVVRAAVENFIYGGVLPKTRRRAANRGLGKVPKAKPKKKGGGGSHNQHTPAP